MGTDARADRTRRFPLPVQIAIVTATIIAVLWLGRLVVQQKLSQAFFEQADLPTAFGVNPHDGIAAGYLAWTLEKDGHAQIAEPLARRAFQDTPLSAPALGALAMAVLPREPKLGQLLLNRAAAMGWRDSMVQVRLARDALDREDAIAAAKHIDAAARVEGVTVEVRAIVDRMANSPEARPALAARLGMAPTWRIQYFLSSEPPLGDLGARANALAAIARAPVPASTHEAAFLVSIASRAVDLVYGYRMWRSLVTPTLPHLVFDPDYRHAANRDDYLGPFAWMLADTLGVSIEPAEDGGRATLHVTTDGTAAGPVAVQILQIPPGRHRILASGRYTAPPMASAFRWSIVCGDAHHPTKPVPPIAGNSTGDAGFAFEIPADGSCPMQWLELSAQPTDMVAQSDAWFSNVRIL